MKMNRFMFSTHQGIGLLVGIQVFLWITSGFVMSVVPIEKVRGEDWVTEHPPQVVADQTPLIAPNEVTLRLELTGAEQMTLISWLERPVYRVVSGKALHLVDATTGELLSPITAEQARAVAEHDYAGPGAVAEVRLFDEEIIEIRGRKLPLWRIDFDDSRNSTVYVSRESGQVVARRNKIWRIYDFFWMLHIMDYSERNDFNHPLLITAAVVAWLLATSGLWLVVSWLQRLSKRRRRAA